MEQLFVIAKIVDFRITFSIYVNTYCDILNGRHVPHKYGKQYNYTNQPQANVYCWNHGTTIYKA